MLVHKYGTQVHLHCKKGFMKKSSLLHGRIQRGGTGGPDPLPEKSQKYRVFSSPEPKAPR